MTGFTDEIEYVTLLNSVPDGLVLVDDEGVIRDANDQVYDLFGYSADELEGAPIEILVPEPLREEHAEYRREFMTDPVQRPMGSGLQLVGQREDGTVFPVDVSLAPIEREGRPWAVGSVRNVSERVGRQQRLSVLTRVLRHDISNRLNVILGNAELCKESIHALGSAVSEVLGDDPTIPETIDDLESQSAEIVALLADLDEFTDEKIGQVEMIIDAASEIESIAERARRIDSILGPGGKEHDPISLETVLDTAIRAVDTEFPDATIVTDIGPTPELRYPQDMLRISVEELLRNAIEHSGVPAPRVTIATALVEDSTLSISITDSGPGLPEREASIHTQSEERPLEHSSGFGLWEVNWLVTRMGGEVRFAENDPRGTIATIRLSIDQE